MARRRPLTLLLKGLPLAYNKDMQETQEPVFAVDYVAQMLQASGSLYARARISIASA